MHRLILAAALTWTVGAMGQTTGPAAPAAVAPATVPVHVPSAAAAAGAPAPGQVSGSAYLPTPASRRAAIEEAHVALPAAATGAAPFFGRWADLPAASTGRVPVVIFLHGSSGLRLPAIEAWQRWLAAAGIASVAPDSFALADRLTYTSPVGKDVYEKIHALRASEIETALAAVSLAPWADVRRLALAGMSEGAVAVARDRGTGFAARIIYSWSCEDNYFVESHRTSVPLWQPVLNVMSASDPYFSQYNTYLGNPAALGHCAAALKSHRNAEIVLIPGAPHTLLLEPAAMRATLGFLQAAFEDPARRASP